VRSDVIALEVKPAAGTVHVGTAIQLNLFATTRGGGTDLVPGNMAAWASSDESVAEVNRQGRLSPRRPGTVSITATHAGKSASAVFTAVG
jgi:uncharacterized protein YjdB